MAAVPALRGQEGEALAIRSSRRGVRAAVRRHACFALRPGLRPAPRGPVQPSAALSRRAARPPVDAAARPGAPCLPDPAARCHLPGRRRRHLRRHDPAAARRGAADPQPSLLLEAADGRVFATRGSFRGVHVRLEDLPPYTRRRGSSPSRTAASTSHLGSIRAASCARRWPTSPPAASREGGSTITQQLAKLLFLSHERTFTPQAPGGAARALAGDASSARTRSSTRYLNTRLFRRRRLRHRGGRAPLFRQARRRADAARGRDAGRPGPGALAARADPQSRRRASARRDGAATPWSRPAPSTQAAADEARAHPGDPARPSRRRPAPDLLRRLGRRRGAARFAGSLSGRCALSTTLDLDCRRSPRRVVRAARRRGRRPAASPGGPGRDAAGRGRRWPWSAAATTPQSQFNRAVQAQAPAGLGCSSSSSTWRRSTHGFTPETRSMVDQPLDIDGWQPRELRRPLPRRGHPAPTPSRNRSTPSRRSWRCGRPAQVIAAARDLGIAVAAAPIRASRSAPPT